MKKNKITFLGDVMCEPMLLKSAYTKNDMYDFRFVFENVKGLLAEADYVVANLETPLAGKESVYTHGLFSFNAPDAFADALKAAGINLVNTANNHCLDRGIDGLVRTLKVLDEKGIGHTGTFSMEKEREEAYYFSVKGIRFAVISYTYGTNFYETQLMLNEEQQNMINLLRPQQESCYILKKEPQKYPIHIRAWRKFLSFFPIEEQCAIKKLFHQTYNLSREDNNLNEKTCALYIAKMQEDIRKAKQKSDFVIFYPHVGGQFNINPGVITDYVFAKAREAGCDAIIASHPHIIQKAECLGGIPCFYSIGNFSMSPNSVYLLHENLPAYGLAVHLYFENGLPIEVAFSILKIIESSCKSLTVFPIDELYAKVCRTQQEELEKDVRQIYKVVTGKDLQSTEIRREYKL